MKKILITIGLIISCLSGYSQVFVSDGGGVDAYTKTQLQTSGSAHVHLDNLDNNIIGKEYFYPSTKYNQSTADSAKILLIGDSRVSSFRYYLPVGLTNLSVPLGYTPFGDNGTSGSFHKLIVSGVTYKETGYSNDKEFGISGEVTKFISTSQIDWTADSSGSLLPLGENRNWYNKIIVFWCARANGGVFKYMIDGANWVNVSTASTVDSLGYTVINPPAWNGVMAFRHLRIKGVSDTVYFYGLQTDFTLNGDRVQINNISKGGTSAQQWATYSKYWKGYVNYYKPTAIHISHGSNDIGSSRTPAQYISDIETIADTSQKYSPDADIVLWSQFDAGSGDDYATTIENHRINFLQQRLLLLSTAKVNNYSVFDWRKLMGNAASIADYGFWTDGIHLNASGNAFTAKCLRDVVTRFSKSNSLANKYLTNYFTKGIYVHMTGYTYGAANETPFIGFYSTATSGGKAIRGGFYMPSTSRIYLNIAGTDYYQLRTDYFSSATGEVNTPSSTNSIVAGTGITSAMLVKKVIVVQGSGGAVDITANPQIANGTSGQLIELWGASDTNTLTLDDGTGLLLNGDASCVLGLGDCLVLRYFSSIGWREVSRSNN